MTKSVVDFDIPLSLAQNAGENRLTKLRGPAIDAGANRRSRRLLLSHYQHADNLDPAGHRVLEAAPATYTTTAGASVSRPQWTPGVERALKATGLPYTTHPETFVVDDALTCPHRSGQNTQPYRTVPKPLENG